MNFETERQKIIQERKGIIAKIGATDNLKRKCFLYYECQKPLEKRLMEIERSAA